MINEFEKDEIDEIRASSGFFAPFSSILSRSSAGRRFIFLMDNARENLRKASIKNFYPAVEKLSKNKIGIQPGLTRLIREVDNYSSKKILLSTAKRLGIDTGKFDIYNNLNDVYELMTEVLLKKGIFNSAKDINIYQFKNELSDFIKGISNINRVKKITLGKKAKLLSGSNPLLSKTSEPIKMIDKYIYMINY